MTPQESALKRFALFGSSVSVDKARDIALPVFGEIFKRRMNDYYGAYWLGHWHVPAEQSEWSGDEVEICENIMVDEDGEGLKESDYPDSPTLLYVSGSSPEVESQLRQHGFTLLRIDEV